MKSLALGLARFCVSAWVGAAVLFVIVAVREVTFPPFTSEVKDQLAVIRFPAYYATGAALLGIAWAGTLIAAGHLQLPRGRCWLAAALLTVALVEMGADYVWIYRPLEALVTPPGKVRTEQFTTLHQWSTRVNAANVALCAVAAGVLCWPVRRACPLAPVRGGEG
jgi:hypothetical protein